MSTTTLNPRTAAVQPQFWAPYQGEPANVPFVDPRQQVARPMAAPARPSTNIENQKIDQGRYWVGATLTAAVAGLAGVIGMVVVNEILHIDLIGPSVGAGVGAQMATFGLISALVALVAALVYDGMRAFAPRPTVYYTAVTALITALAVLLPFTAGVAILTALGAAAVNLLVGLLIMILVPVAASNARVRG